MKTIFKLFLFPLLFCLNINTTHAQRTTKIGFTGGAARFYPEAQHLGSGRNNSMDNGWGWSAGIFAEDHWKPKIHQIVEINYYNLSGDVYLESNPVGQGGYGVGEQPIRGDFRNTPFNLLAVSGGIKYFLNKSLFVHPGFEFARSLNKNIDINRTTYNLKLGAGADIKGVDIILEYAYGLKYQRMVYDPDVPLASTHRNKYLQLKIQIPLYKIRQ